MSEPVFQFEEFELHCGRFQLLRRGRPLRVEPKPLELLILLVSRKGHLVSRREIVEKLWENGVFVDTDHSINTAIRKLRYLLRDDSETPKFIETVTGMGYRFVAPVSLVAPVLSAQPVSPVASVSVPSPAAPREDTPEPTPAPASPPRRRALVWSLGVGACMLIALVSVTIYRWPHRRREVRYTQLTDFTDSAVTPTLSPDGHMLAFIRGRDDFLTSDQIYVKMLPNGEARRVTDDNRPKYGVAFSPDGTEIAYTVLETTMFSSYAVSALGGESHLLLRNAAGLVWLDRDHLLFSEIRPGDGIHLGVVTATATRAGLREIYFPAHERAMAHYSFPSPDRRWALVVEMDGNGHWAQCRLVALVGQSEPRLVGPVGACTAAGWSPDGNWMYFTAAPEARSHIWRQHFPDGAPEQITFGPTQEEGVAVEPDGKALITSVGVRESAIWIHDGSSERPLSSEGEVVGWDTPFSSSPPAFSPDDSVIYYLLRQGEGSDAELWRTAVDSGKSDAVFSGISMTDFDVSPDGKQVVYTTAAQDGTTQLWIAALDGSSAAVKVNVSGVRSPHFGAGGQILVQRTEGNKNYLEQISPDGSHRSKIVPYPIGEFQSVSPDRRWVTAEVPRASAASSPTIMAIPVAGGVPQCICTPYCRTGWSTDGKFLFVSVEESSRTSPGRSLAIPVGPGESLPTLPVGGIPPLAETSVLHGAESVGHEDLIPGRDPEHYAWVNTTIHRNLYRISLP